MLQWHKSKQSEDYKMKKTISLILVISIVLGFLGMIGAWLATL